MVIPNMMLSFVDELEKLGATRKQPEYSESEKNLLAAGGTAVGGTMANSSADKVVGTQKVHHITRAEHAADIKKNGLRASFGGNVRGVDDGAVSAKLNEKWKRDSKGHVHVTTSPLSVGIYKSQVKQTKGGPVHFKGHIPFDDFTSKFHKDPNGLPGDYRGKTDVGAKHFAHGGGFIGALKNKGDWKAYVRKHPKRFGAGVAQAALGTAMTGASVAHLVKSLKGAKKKEAAISDDQARASLDRYDALEKSKFTPGQVGRYASLGAAGGIGIGAVKDVIQQGKVLGGKYTPKAMLRHAAGSAVHGALASGAIPLIRNQMDRGAERATLQKYLKQQQQPKQAAATGITPAKRWSANEYADMGKMGTFEMSQYTSKLPKEDTLPESKLASLLIALTPKLALATTPAGRLAQAKGVGLPKMSPPPGPSISQVSRTFGPPAVGAIKGGIGKGMAGSM